MGVNGTNVTYIVTANQSPEPTQPTQYDIITLRDNTQAERSNEHGKNI